MPVTRSRLRPGLGPIAKEVAEACLILAGESWGFEGDTGPMERPEATGPSATSDYAKTWLRSLSVANSFEDWHFAIIQSQFVDAETEAARQDFLRAWSGHSTSGVPRKDRLLIVTAAVRILLRAGIAPRVSAFWWPELTSEASWAASPWRARPTGITFIFGRRLVPLVPCP